MRLAELTRLVTAKARVHTVLGRSFLLVERYDRLLMNNGQYSRIHQEDFCQALGVMPDQKYQNESGPDLAQCFELLRQATRPNAPQVLRLLDYVIFNVLVGNHDAHAKNFSLLYSGARPVLAPAKARVHTVLGRSFLLVERYDRLLMNDGHYARLHQEDFCQALGVMPRARDPCWRRAMTYCLRPYMQS